MNRKSLIPGGAATVLLGLGVIVLLMGLARGTTTVSGYYDLKRSREVLKQTVASLQTETEQIAAEIERIRTSPSYARKVLRDKYHLTEPNEDIVFFAD
ncbi:MAG: septum formation initiator family protein [Deltaproteobacteria bacterium]|nr:septum formation initiator family protein [Deltaproteobacteria bacterium]